MNSTVKDILTSQQEYAARPFAARVQTGNFSGTFRFDAFEDAVAYLRQQVKRHGILPVRSADNWSNDGVRPHRFDTCVIMPDGSELDLEALGVAAQPQGPLANWIVLS